MMIWSSEKNPGDTVVFVPEMITTIDPISPSISEAYSGEKESSSAPSHIVAATRAREAGDGGVRIPRDNGKSPVWVQFQTIRLISCACTARNSKDHPIAAE